jgi:hypothetical protein
MPVAINASSGGTLSYLWLSGSRTLSRCKRGPSDWCSLRGSSNTVDRRFVRLYNVASGGNELLYQHAPVGTYDYRRDTASLHATESELH